MNVSIKQLGVRMGHTPGRLQVPPATINVPGTGQLMVGAWNP